LQKWRKTPKRTASNKPLRDAVFYFINATDNKLKFSGGLHERKKSIIPAVFEKKKNKYQSYYIYDIYNIDLMRVIQPAGSCRYNTPYHRTGSGYDHVGKSKRDYEGCI